MSVKTITIVQCDKCGKEIKGRLIVKVCPCCKADICLECWSAEDAKTAKKKEAPEKKTRKAIVFPPASKDKDSVLIDVPSTDNLLIHIATGEGKDTKHKIKILNSEAEGDTLKGGTLKSTVIEALEPWNGEIPTTLLTETEVKTLKGILEAGE